MVQQLHWPTLEARRHSSDLVLMYKVVNSLVAVPTSYYPAPSPRHDNKFVTYQCRINAYQHSFFPRVVVAWNKLPQTVLQLDNLDGFKAAVQPAARV